MVRLRLDLIFEVLSNLSNSLILYTTFHVLKEV